MEQKEEFSKKYVIIEKKSKISFKKYARVAIYAHCLKITLNVAFELSSTNFCPIKIDLSGNAV